MTDRYSHPSDTVGIDRFHVWPAGSDSYAHAHLQANWDKADAIIGAPVEGTPWPPTEGLDGGIYALYRLLQLERVPIGHVSYYFRPNLSVPTTTWTDAGWAVADGSSLAPSDHNFPGGGTIVLPNLLNRFVLGADVTKTIGTAGVTLGSGQINVASGAPGPQGVGGLNQNTQTIAQMPAHNHGGATGSVGFNNSAANAYDGSGVASNDMLGVGPNALNGEQGNHTHTIASQGSGDPLENRPLYVGLIPLVKVKFVTTF